jgi:hypothetical protein
MINYYALVDVSGYKQPRGIPLEVAHRVQFCLAGLGAGAYRQSPKFSLRAVRDREIYMHASIEMASIPIDAGCLNFWIGFSDDPVPGSGNPANLSGADAAYTGYGTSADDADKAVSELARVGTLMVAGCASAFGRPVGSFVPSGDYGIVVVKNSTGVALKATAEQMSVLISPI